MVLNTFASSRNREFSHQNNKIVRGFAQEFLWSGQRYRPGETLKRRDKSSRLHSKKNFFCLGGWIFCEWRHKWRTFRPPWPTLPGPGRQQLDGNIAISLMFLLETRLQSRSKSFDTLDDLLGFQVQKLRSKAMKIFDFLDN